MELEIASRNGLFEYIAEHVVSGNAFDADILFGNHSHREVVTYVSVLAMRKMANRSTFSPFCRAVISLMEYSRALLNY